MRWAVRLAPCCALVVSVVAHAADDDDLIIIDDTPFAGGSAAAAAGSSDDDPIIIVEDEGAPLAAGPQTGGALGRIWESWHVGIDSDVFSAIQLVDPDDGLWRVLGSLWVESWLLPAPNLSVYANGFARVALDGKPGLRLAPFADLYEAYAKINIDRATVTLGRLVVPFGRTQAAALGDRVNPSDRRRGPPFPDPVRQKQPQWGASARTSLGSVGVEGVFLAAYEPTEGSLAASNQGAVRIGRYQTALVRSPARVGGLYRFENNAPLQGDYPALQTATVAARAWRRVGDFDLSGSVVVGQDETPRLSLDPAVARATAGEGMRARELRIDVPLPCGGAPTLGCHGGSGTLVHDRTTSFSLDASWGLGVVILRAEAVAYPSLFGGRQAHLFDQTGLYSERVSQYAGALAVEGALGDSIDGSIELFNVAWDSVPAGATLWGVELFADDVAASRVVHRLAGAARLGGMLFSERVSWRVQGEAGILQPDVLGSAEVRVRLPVWNLYVGGRTDAFFGLEGSPGWMKQDSSLFGVFLGEGN